MWHNHLEWKNLQTKRKAESLLYGHAGSKPSAFYRDIQDEVMISMKEENEKEADKFLEMLDLIKVKDRHPMSLSGGQKQRVAIAGVMAMRPQCIVLDEPTAMLDPNGRKEVLEQFIS